MKKQEKKAKTKKEESHERMKTKIETPNDNSAIKLSGAHTTKSNLYMNILYTT